MRPGLWRGFARYAALGATLLLVACAMTTGDGPGVRGAGLRGAGVPPLPSLDAQQQRGREFAVRRCSGCHTVGLDDGGAREGPTFSILARRYDSTSLERRFAQVSAHGFDRMPPVELTPANAADLVAYFDTLPAD